MRDGHVGTIKHVYMNNNHTSPPGVCQTAVTISVATRHVSVFLWHGNIQHYCSVMIMSSYNYGLSRASREVQKIKKPKAFRVVFYGQWKHNKKSSFWHLPLQITWCYCVPFDMYNRIIHNMLLFGKNPMPENDGSCILMEHMPYKRKCIPEKHNQCYNASASKASLSYVILASYIMDNVLLSINSVQKIVHLFILTNLLFEWIQVNTTPSAPVDDAPSVISIILSPYFDRKLRFLLGFKAH